jgi:hypothetical protein
MGTAAHNSIFGMSKEIRNNCGEKLKEEDCVESSNGIEF